MCQLLGISSTAPTHYSHSMLEPFCNRGGNTDVHRHGWGLAYYTYRSNDWNVINETNPAATSAYAKEIIKSRRHLDTNNLICHIRYATVGDVSISNVHPFKKTLFGREFVFAHNGDVPMFDDSSSNKATSSKGKRKFSTISDTDCAASTISSSRTTTFHPIGQTDSEYVFCAILNHLQSRFDTLPPLTDLYLAIGEICIDIAQRQEGTILNFLLGFGEVIFAFSWPGARKGSTTWNGLHYTLKKEQQDDVDQDFGEGSRAASRSRSRTGSEVAVITTKPLTDDSSWTEFEKGDLLLFVNGKVVSSVNFYNVDKQ